MKANLQIDDDVYEAAERLASAEKRSLGEVLSGLARKGLELERGEDERGGFPVFSVPEGSPTITLEKVKAALDDF
jgi:hypothetical protein